jgi:hypothetical protein
MFALARILDSNPKHIAQLSDRMMFEVHQVPTVSIPDHYDPQITLNRVPSKKRTYTYRMCGGIRVIYQNIRSNLGFTPEDKSDMNLAGRKAIEALRSCKGSCTNVE